MKSLYIVYISPARSSARILRKPGPSFVDVHCRVVIAGWERELLSSNDAALMRI
jgi:hypothetical protein